MIYKCCDPKCPGLPWPASEIPHRGCCGNPPPTGTAAICRALDARFGREWDTYRALQGWRVRVRENGQDAVVSGRDLPEALSVALALETLEPPRKPRPEILEPESFVAERDGNRWILRYRGFHYAVAHTKDSALALRDRLCKQSRIERELWDAEELRRISAASTEAES